MVQLQLQSPSRTGQVVLLMLLLLLQHLLCPGAL
jgi:hypothetical protein